jgi:hypothetical protein
MPEMQNPPLWIAVLVACVLAVPLLKRLVKRRAPLPLQRKRLSFDRDGEAAEVAEQGQFRLGRLSLGEGAGDGKH